MLKVCGVYRISVGEVSYVGSSTDCAKRWKEHKLALLANRHRYATYFREAAVAGKLVFEVLQECLNTERFELEQYWMDAHPNRINVHRRVHSTGIVFNDAVRTKLSKAHKGKIISPTTRAKMSLARSGLTMPDKTRAALLAANKGRKHTPESKAKLRSAALRRPATVETIQRLRALCASEEVRAKLRAKALDNREQRVAAARKSVEVRRAKALNK